MPFTDIFFSPFKLIEWFPWLRSHIQIRTIQAINLRRVSYVKYFWKFLINPRTGIILT